MPRREVSGYGKEGEEAEAPGGLGPPSRGSPRAEGLTESGSRPWHLGLGGALPSGRGGFCVFWGQRLPAPGPWHSEKRYFNVCGN